MILSKLIKPKWQHRKPNIRQSEVKNNLDDPAILGEIAQNDEAAEVRQAAVRKINDLNLLYQIAQHDTDSTVREIAERQLKQLLCCQKDDCPALETRLNWIKETNDAAEQFAYLAENGPEVELRMAAIEKVEREGLLGDIAINDSNGQIRLTAIEKVTQKSTLERVVKAARNNDKRVSRRAREKIDEIERPGQVRAECDEICASLESLEQRLETSFREIDDSKLKVANTEFKRLQERWQKIAAEADTERQTRFDNVQQAVLAIFDKYQQAKIAAEKREQARAPLRAAKQSLCEKMEALLIELKKYQRLGGEDIKAFNQRISVLQIRWAEIQALDEFAEEQWQARFDRLFQAVQKRQNQLQDYDKTASTLEDLCLKAETLLDKTDKLKADQLKKWKARWNEVSAQAQELPFFNDLNKRFSKTWDALEKRLQKQNVQGTKTRQELNKLLKEIEDVLERGELKTLIPLEQQARELFESLDDSKTDKKLERRFQNCNAKINELRSWQNWGNKLEREKLCEQMESLLESDDPANLVPLLEKAQTAWKRLGASGYSRSLWDRFNQARQSAYIRYREYLCLEMENLLEHAEKDPENAAKLIRQAQNTWKDLGGQGNSQVLWERFNNARQTAYEPCRVYFNLKSQEREKHLLEKQAICDSLEQFAQETDWEVADWKEVYRFVREMDKKWREIGPTDRKHKKGVQQRFQAAMQVLELQLKDERQRNCHSRIHLMLQVESVANQLQAFIKAQPADDKEVKKRIEVKTNEAIEEVKKLQAQWQVTVPGERRVEREFWTSFRSACDVVFDQRKQQQEAHKKQFQAYLDSKIALCEQVEACLEQDAIKTAIGQMKKCQEEWNNIKADWKNLDRNTLRRKAKTSEAVDDRFAKACEQVEKQYYAQLGAERREQLDRLKQKAALCVELEQAETLDGLSTVQAAWAEIPPLENADLEAAIERRFQQACTGAPKVSEDALKNKENLCIRLEILAGIDSPPEAAKARLAHQVARLSAAMGGAELEESREPQVEAEEIEQSWYLSGAAPSDQTARLEQRFRKACEAFK